MSGAEWAVVLGGIIAIGAVNWWFFLAEGQVARLASGPGGIQEVRIAVKGGYSPSSIHVKSGEPVRLVFERQETNPCSEEVVLPDFGVRRFLPPHRDTAIEVRPEKPGTYEFTCGMSMMRGRIIAE